MKNKPTVVFVFQKYGKFWSISLGHFIKHKLPISEGWVNKGKFFNYFQPSFLQFRLDRFETSLNLPKENHIKITENKVLTNSLENKENNVPNFSSCEQNTDNKNHQIEKNSSNHYHDDQNNPGDAENNENNNKDEDDIEETEIDKPLKKSTGPRALKRRHGKKFTKSGLQRRKSFNGHW